MVREYSLVEGFDTRTEKIRLEAFRNKYVVHTSVATCVGGGVIFNSVAGSVTVDEATSEEDGCHAMGIFTDLLIEITHEDHIVAFAA